MLALYAAALRRVPAPRAMPPMLLWLLYHEDLRRSPRVRAAVAFVDEVVAARRVLVDELRARLPVAEPD